MAYVGPRQSPGACCDACAKGHSCVGDTGTTAAASQLAAFAAVAAVLFLVMKKR